MAEPVGSSNAMYLYIIQGHLMQNVKEGTPGAIEREWKSKSDGRTGKKWELQYKNLTGHITDVTFKDSDFGEQCIIKMESDGEKAQLQIATDSKYFSSFGCRFSNINFDLPVTINAYDFENENKKRMTGLSITQDGKKLKNYFWDDISKAPINGLPIPGDDSDSYDKDDWKYHFSKVKKFLKLHIETALSNMITGDQPPATSPSKPMTERSTPEPSDDADDDLPF
jgi:hypothetical protein